MKIKSTSKFIQAGLDVQDKDWITILDEGKYMVFPQFPDRENLVFKIELPNGDKKSLTMNATSQKDCILAWGDDSTNWIGKRCQIEIRIQQVFDKQKGVIYLHPQEKVAEIPEEKIPIVE